MHMQNVLQVYVHDIMIIFLAGSSLLVCVCGQAAAQRIDSL